MWTLNSLEYERCIIDIIWFDLISLFNDISTFVGYLMPKQNFEKNSNDAI